MGDTILKMRTGRLVLLLLIAAVGAARAATLPFFEGAGDIASFRGFEDDAGGFYLVWVDEMPGKTATLRAQHIGPDEKLMWEAAGIVVSSDLTSVRDWNGLADGQGGLTLYWDESDGVHAQRFQGDGTRRRQGQSVRMSSSTAIQPDAVPDASGGTFIVWDEILPDKRSVLLVQRRDSEGRPVWPASGMRVSLRVANQTNARMVYDNVSGIIVAWRDEVNQASELRVQRIDFQGNRLWGPMGLRVMAPMGKSEFPQMAPLGTGEAVLAWTDSVAQTNQIFLQKAGPDRKLQWDRMTLAANGTVTYNRWNPVVLGDEAGGAWIAWEDFRNQINYQIQLNHLHGDGKSAWATGEVAAAPAAGDQGKVAMAHDGKNGVWVSWMDNRLATVGIYVQEILANGAPAQAKQGYMVADHLSKPTTPQLVELSEGRAAVLWADRPKKGRWTLFWTVVKAPPPQKPV